MTCGGAKSGNCAMGSEGMEIAPARIINSAQTVAKTGRRMKKSTNKEELRLGLKWIGAVHVVDRHYRAALPLLSPATCSVTAIPSCKNCVPDTMTWSPGFKPSSTAKSFPMVSPSFNVFCRATVPFASFTETNAKNWPLMRCTASTGITGPSCVPQVICARTCCAMRSLPGAFSTMALASTLCVSVSTCGDTNVDVRFQRSRLIDRCQHRRHRYAVADSNRNIAHDPVHRRCHAVIVKLNFLLSYLLIERLQLRHCGIIPGLRIVEFLFADHSGIQQLLRPLQGNLGVPHVGFLRCAGGFLAVQHGFLPQWINLQQRSSCGNSLAGFHENSCDQPFHLRIDGRRVPRLQQREILRGLGNFHHGRNLHLHGDSRGCGSRILGSALLAAKFECASPECQQQSASSASCASASLCISN